MKILLIPAAFAACLAVVPAPARAETRACTAITSLPATLSASGVYCLKNDLSTEMLSGTAITITADAVTVDCNGYKLGGLAAGPASQATGIGTAPGDEVDLATIRGCSIRGFFKGVSLSGNALRVADNRFDGSLRIGIEVLGEHSEIRRNRVFDTAGSGLAYGIRVEGSAFIVGNTVSGAVTVGSFPSIGIYASDANALMVVDNRVRGVAGDGSAMISGMHLATTSYGAVHGNHVVGTGGGTGILCSAFDGPVFDANTVASFTTDTSGCNIGPD